MKKLITIILVLLALTPLTFAKKAKKSKNANVKTYTSFPEGRRVFAALWAIVENPPNNSAGKTMEFDLPTKLDTQKGEYQVKFFSYFKSFPSGLQRQAVEMSIKESGSSIQCSVVNIGIISCDGNKKPIPGSSPIAFKSQLRKLVTDYENWFTQYLYELLNILSVDQYEAMFNDTVASPFFLSIMKDSCSLLYFKSFISDNKVEGRTTRQTVRVQKIDTNTVKLLTGEEQIGDFKYRAYSYMEQQLLDGGTRSIFLVILSNHDNWINMSRDSVCTVTGTIRSIDVEESYSGINGNNLRIEIGEL